MVRNPQEQGRPWLGYSPRKASAALLWRIRHGGCFGLIVPQVSREKGPREFNGTYPIDSSKGAIMSNATTRSAQNEAEKAKQSAGQAAGNIGQAASHTGQAGQDLLHSAG